MEKIKELDINYSGGPETFRKVLHDIGFNYKRRDGTRYIIEQPHIILKRMEFLTEMKEHLEKNRNIIYQDETWTFKRGTGKRKDWQDENVLSCSVKDPSTGDRYIICHAGGKNGFVPNASLFVSTVKKPKKHDDYHGDMNGEMFYKWFTKQLLPNLPESSVIVMDNASYHSVRVRINYLRGLYDPVNFDVPHKNQILK